MKRSVDELLNDLIAEAARDGDEGRLEYGPKVIALKEKLLGIYSGGEADAAQRNEAGPVQAVRGEPDSPGRLGGEDLSDVRRVAANSGAADRPAPPATGHHIMISTSVLAVPVDSPEDAGRFTSIWPARFELWACGPCQEQGVGRSPGERNQQVADHVAGR